MFSDPSASAALYFGAYHLIMTYLASGKSDRWVESVLRKLISLQRYQSEIILLSCNDGVLLIERFQSAWLEASSFEQNEEKPLALMGCLSSVSGNHGNGALR
jgi:hypothetical protein